MRNLNASFLTLVLGFGMISVTLAEEPPVPFPDLKHYSALWEKSLFTTRDLPSPDAPAGPIFTDSLSLAGVYEVDGSVVAVLVDRTTSQIMEARVGTENEVGIKIRKVTPGATMDKTKVQLQKGDQAGWVTFSEESSVPVQAPAPGLQTRQPATPPSTPALSSPLLPPVQNPVPAVPSSPAAPSDVPLPPP